MTLQFPNTPTDGQVYTDTNSGNRWVWDSANTVWKSTSTFTQTITVSSSQPGSPVVGQLWWNQDYGRLFIYYNDGTSNQWVDATLSPDISGIYGVANAANLVASASYNTANSGYVVANAAFGKANTALQNTTGTFAGSLNVIGTVTAANTAAGTTTGIILDNGSTSSLPNVKISWANAGAVKSSIIANVFGLDYMAFNVGSDTERMRIDNSGNVGIGTSSPGYNLDVLGKIRSNVNSGGNLIFPADSGQEWWTGAFTDLTSYQITRRQIASPNSWSRYFGIDTSGRVTKPNQPAWSAHTGTFSGTVTGSPNHVSGISYSGFGLPNGTLVNVGSIMNTTTGRVTIPVAGYYQINIIGHKDTNTVTRDAIATLSVNGGYFEMVELYGNYQDGGASVILYLAANDWVEAGRNNGLPNVNRITFSGYLLG